MAAKTKSIKSPVDAVQVIFDALEPLDVDARQRVISSVLSLFGMPPSAPASVSQSQTVAHAQRGTDPGTRIKSPVELIQEKQPATNAQRITLFAYYREKFEGIGRFSRGDLKPYFSKAKEPPPANYDRDFSAAVRSGWIHEDGAESYLTSKGLETVEAGFAGKAMPRGSSSPRKGSRKQNNAQKRAKR
jgi:hypothetical protein